MESQDRSSRQPVSELVWWPARGYGRQLPNEQFDYGHEYFERCSMQEETIVGKKLISLRRSMLGECIMDPIVDVGIGGGGFVKSLPQSRGYDVCPQAKKWLEETKRWHDLSTMPAHTVCFWDSLEHMLSPEAILRNVALNAFMSLPIFESAEHVLASKHYKPNEHIWYFTEKGLIGFMRSMGFSMIERNRDEERLGRDGIGTYWFRRR